MINNKILLVTKTLLILVTAFVLALIFLSIGYFFDSFLLFIWQRAGISDWSNSKWIVQLFSVIFAILGTYFVWKFASNSKKYNEKIAELFWLNISSIYTKIQNGIENRNKKPDFLDVSIHNLRKSARRLTTYGIVILIGSVILAIFLYLDIKYTTELQIDALKQAKSENVYVLLAYYIIRGAALGALATTTLFVLIKIANACFDQATRFTKRRNGALFLKFVYEKYEGKMDDEKISISEIMKFFEAWNQNVESAFTSVKVEKHAVSNTNVEIGKDGVKASTNSE